MINVNVAQAQVHDEWRETDVIKVFILTGKSATFPSCFPHPHFLLLLLLPHTSSLTSLWRNTPLPSLPSSFPSSHPQLTFTSPSPHAHLTHLQPFFPFPHPHFYNLNPFSLTLSLPFLHHPLYLVPSSHIFGHPPHLHSLLLNALIRMH